MMAASILAPFRRVIRADRQRPIVAIENHDDTTWPDDAGGLSNDGRGIVDMADECVRQHGIEACVGQIERASVSNAEADLLGQSLLTRKRVAASTRWGLRSTPKTRPWKSSRCPSCRATKPVPHPISSTSLSVPGAMRSRYSSSRESRVSAQSRLRRRAGTPASYRCSVVR